MYSKCIRDSEVSGFTIKRNNIGRISNVDDTRRSITGTAGISALQQSAEGLGSSRSGFSENRREGESKIEEGKREGEGKRTERIHLRVYRTASVTVVKSGGAGCTFHYTKYPLH